MDKKASIKLGLLACNADSGLSSYLKKRKLEKSDLNALKQFTFLLVAAKKAANFILYNQYAGDNIEKDLKCLDIVLDVLELSGLRNKVQLIPQLDILITKLTLISSKANVFVDVRFLRIILKELRNLALTMLHLGYKNVEPSLENAV